MQSIPEKAHPIFGGKNLSVIFRKHLLGNRISVTFSDKNKYSILGVLVAQNSWMNDNLRFSHDEGGYLRTFEHAQGTVCYLWLGTSKRTSRHESFVVNVKISDQLRLMK